MVATIFIIGCDWGDATKMIKTPIRAFDVQSIASGAYFSTTTEKFILPEKELDKWKLLLQKANTDGVLIFRDNTKHKVYGGYRFYDKVGKITLELTDLGNQIFEDESRSLIFKFDK